MSRPKKFNEQQIIKAIANTGGLKSQICSNLHCDLKTLNKYIDEYPAIKEALDTETDKVLDMAEGALFQLIQNGEANAIFYYLNNKGQKRGYGSKANLTYMDSNEKTQGVVGVLVTPGMLTDTEWEKAANPQTGGSKENVT